MKNEIESVFVIESSGYVEMTYQEFLERRSTDMSYKSRRFILVEKHLMELSEENYRAYYKEKRRVKYVKERERKIGVFSYDALSDRGICGEELIDDQEVDVCDLAVSRTLVENLRNCLSLLTDEEYHLIRLRFYEQLTEAEIGRLCGVSQQSISKRLAGICKKIKNLMKI